jgi:hypothetical protein
MDTDQQHDEAPANDLLVGGEAIEKFLESLGYPKTVDAYYLRRSKWPIGKTGSGQSAKLVASKRRLIRHTQKMAASQKTEFAPVAT